ncbi:hypothetical protein MRX96_057366 [Rhipicephalus microplus]
MRIADGNTSDISSSDDEEGDHQPAHTDNQPDAATGPSSPVDENDNDGEFTAKTRVSWTAKNFVHPRTTYYGEYDDPVAVAEPIEYFLNPLRTTFCSALQVRTRILCQKCNVFLCLSAIKNCFSLFIRNE